MALNADSHGGVDVEVQVRILPRWMISVSGSVDSTVIDSAMIVRSYSDFVEVLARGSADWATSLIGA